MTRNVVSTSVFAAVFGIATLGVVGAQAPQPDKEKPAAQAEKEKPAGDKTHTMTGCLEKGADPTMFTLTNIEGAGPKTVQLHADAGKKLAAHVGHKISVTGTEVDPKTMQKGTAGKPEGGAGATPGAEEHHMRVNSMKMIADSCK